MSRSPATGSIGDADHAIPPEREGLAHADLRLEEDQQLLAAWSEELSERLEERSTLQARLRDRIEDARDHLESLRQAARERIAELETPQTADVAESDGATGSEELVAPRPVVQPFTHSELTGYHFPSLDFLRPPSGDETRGADEAEVEDNKRLLQDTLDSFALDAVVHDAIVGPRVTQFRVRPGFGVRVESISGLEKNIALAMSARSVRIQAPIPGESFVGVEIPNRNASPLSLRAAFESEAWVASKADIPIVLGRDITGKVVLCDLARAPHALIAGATGSGKSV
jgi:S-DNA-T family DNA segregation ATPase FtsK/SpoIIIE